MVWRGVPDIPHNIGILTGEPSGGLVDVDCDAPEARAAAAELLPPTGMISGRLSSPASHYWYKVEWLGKTLLATAKFGDVTAASLPALPTEARRSQSQRRQMAGRPNIVPC